MSFFLSGSLVGSVHAGPLCVLQQQRALWISVEERRDPAPEIQYSRSNSKRKIPGWKSPPFPYHITQLLQQQASELTRGMRVDRNQRESEQENERARERESARARGECERKTSLTRKNEHDKPENEREEGSELYTKSLLYMDEWTNFQFLLSFIHSFYICPHPPPPSHYLSVKPFFRLLSSVDPNDNDRLINSTNRIRPRPSKLSLGCRGLSELCGHVLPFSTPVGLKSVNFVVKRMKY